MPRTVFIAHPAEPNELAVTINAAVHLAKLQRANLAIKAWPQLDVFGSHIPDELRDKIKYSDVLVCDITFANMNVYYEIGLAIGAGRSVAPVINASFADALAEVRRDGLFDTIGYKTYENSEDLASILVDLPISNLKELYAKKINHQQPLFMLQAFRKTDFINKIVSTVKASKVHFRSFDPVEVPRLSTVMMVGEITASAGVIVPILGENIDDARRHNLRAAFTTGLSHGLDRQTLLVKLANHEEPDPVDYRDFVRKVDLDGIDEIVTEFASSTLVSAQSISASKQKPRTSLQTLAIGASAAENEFRTLDKYFVETAEFLRTLRGEVNVVAGRKGSGKTAIFFRVRDLRRSEKNSLVIDLKPESHQLSLFRQQLQEKVGEGVFDHTLAAYWHFVLLTEILLTIKRDLDWRSKFDAEALEKAQNIEVLLNKFNISESGDFTTRMSRLETSVIEQLKCSSKAELTPDTLTNMIFRGAISAIKESIKEHTNSRTELIILFDNIDKGWPASGVDVFDIRLVRLLIEGLDKIGRDFRAQGREYMSVLFLRNDIYELLVEGTPDRQKAGQVRIDWTDRAKLRQVIFSRLQTSNSAKKEESFDNVWARYFTPKVGNRESFDYFVDHCLMRPRFLINIIENAVANAINRGHNYAEEEDCVDAVRQHSNYLIDDFGYEIRDVSGLSEDILYHFVGVTQLLTREEVHECLLKGSLCESEIEKAFRLLLWYGALGVSSKDGDQRFIYDYDYNIKRLEAEMEAQHGSDLLFIVNPALHVALYH